MLIGLFKDDSRGPPSNLYTCISLLEFYWFGQCLGWRFSPMSIFWSPLCSCTFSDAPHLRFLCRDPKRSFNYFYPKRQRSFPKINPVHNWTLHKNIRVFQRRTNDVVLDARLSYLFNKMVRQMTILTKFGNFLIFFWNKRIFCQKKNYPVVFVVPWPIYHRSMSEIEFSTHAAKLTIYLIFTGRHS